MYTLEVTGGNYYIDGEKEVLLSDLDKQKPRYTDQPHACSFLSFFTICNPATGVDVQSCGKGISGAVISVQGRDMRTRTTAKGEFVLCFTGLNRADSETVEKLVKLKGNDPVLEITLLIIQSQHNPSQSGKGQSHHIQLPVPEHIGNRD